MAARRPVAASSSVIASPIHGSPWDAWPTTTGAPRRSAQRRARVSSSACAWRSDVPATAATTGPSGQEPVECPEQRRADAQRRGGAQDHGGEVPSQGDRGRDVHPDVVGRAHEGGDHRRAQGSGGGQRQADIGEAESVVERRDVHPQGGLARLDGPREHLGRCPRAYVGAAVREQDDVRHEAARASTAASCGTTSTTSPMTTTEGLSTPALATWSTMSASVPVTTR